MTQINRIDRDACGRIRHELQNALRQVEEELGIKLTMGRIKFTDDNASFKMEAAVLNSEGAPMTREATNWQYHAPRFGLPSDWVGKTISTIRGTYRITGWNTRASNYKVQAIRISDGVAIKMSPQSLCNATVVDE